MALRRSTHSATLITTFFIGLVSFIGIVYAMSFSLSSSTAESEDTLSTTMGDFDGDGDTDYIAFSPATWGVSSMRLYRNNGSGTFTPDSTFASENNGFVAAADIDGDGDLDLLSIETASTHIYKYTNDGTGSFTMGTVSSSVSGLAELVVGDFNHDGSLDFVTISTNAQTQALFTNNGSGTFTARNSSLPSTVNFGTAADFDSDGYLDLALLSATSVVKIMRNSGTGAFVQIASFTLSVGVGSNSLLTHDIDADGDIDILKIDGVVGFGVAKNDGTGTSFPTTSGPYGGPVTSNNFAYGDFDNDGDFDIEIAGEDFMGINGGNELWINNGPGTSYSLHHGEAEEADKTYGVGVADIDADGDLDYVAANKAGVNRHYKSNQAATLANAVPSSAPTSLSASVSASGNGSGTIVLTWGSGTDAITSQRMLQYQVRMGTTSNAHNIVTGVRASPFWVSRMMPNGQSRRMILRQLPCNQTYYWSVAAIDSGFMSTWATQVIFTLDASCNYSEGAGSSSASGGGWGWNVLRQSQGGGGQSAKTKISVSVFRDLDQDGKRSSYEDFFKGSILTIQGITSKGKFLRRAVEMTGDTAVFSVTPSDDKGYTFSIDASSDVLSGLRPTTPASQTIVVKAGDADKSISFAVSPFLDKKTCLFVTTPRSGEAHGNEPMVLLQRLQDTFGHAVSAGVDLHSSLVEREDVARLLLRLTCIDPSTDPVRLRKDLRTAFDAGRIPGKSIDLRDLSLAKLSISASEFYTLLSEGVHIAKQTSKGPLADPKAPMTQGEFVEAVATTLPSELLVTVASDDEILPSGFDALSPVAPYYRTLLHLGLLPASLQHSFDPKIGLTWQQASDVLAKLAYKLGRIELRPVAGSTADQPTFMNVLPKGILATVCGVRDDARKKNIVYLDASPGGEYYSDLQTLLPLGTKNSDGKTLWVLPGSGLTEYGIEHGESLLKADEYVTLSSLLRTSVLYLCQPPHTRMDVITGRDRENIQGTADNLSPRDVLTGLKKDATLLSRLSYAAQEKTLPYNLHMLSFDPEYLRANARLPLAIVSRADAARILSSMFLVKAVRAGTISTEKASQFAQELRYAIQSDLVHRKTDWRTDQGGDLAEPLTNGDLVRILSAPLRSLRTSSDTATEMSLGLQWYFRIHK